MTQRERSALRSLLERAMAEYLRQRTMRLGYGRRGVKRLGREARRIVAAVVG